MNGASTSGKKMKPISSFKTKVNLRLPRIESYDGSKAFEALNNYWYGAPTIPIPTPEYPNSQAHLEATQAMCCGREIELEVDLYPDGSWVIKSQEIRA